MIKKLLIAFGVFALVAVIAIVGLGWWAYRVFTGPMYEPGALASLRTLQPPAQEAGDPAWVVQPGIRLYHFSSGSGRPILFVHGGPGFPVREPMPWLETINGSHRVVFYDQRGCGTSTRPIDRFESENAYANMQRLESALGLGAQVADIERIRRLLGEERLIIVGHSFGGFLAALYAAEFPERVEKLILLAPANVLVMPTDDADLFTLVRDRLPPDEAVQFDGVLDEYLDFGALFERDEAGLARLNLRLGVFILRAMDHDPPPMPDDDDAIDAGGWMVQAMYLSMGRRHDYTEALGRITADTLVAHGADDLVPAETSVRYTQLIDDAEMLIVPGADHFFTGDQPELAARVSAFLE
ncbi:MAG: alpha/beta hydrolase [Planctomycetes bacterium]|nr:alpha/beta hydrolase [Planctomycetota bacterium]